MNKKQWMPAWAWGLVIIATFVSSVGVFVLYAGLEVWAEFEKPHRNWTVTISAGITLLIINLAWWFLYYRDYRVKRYLGKPNGPGVTVTPARQNNP